MNLLALDTATEACSAALCRDGSVTARYEVAPRDHTRLVLPMVEGLLRDAGLAPGDLDALAFGRGPGSFTGVRIATSVVQGIALGAGLPVVGVSSLAAIAQRAWREHQASPVMVCLDARMGEVYWGVYRVDAGGVMQLQGDEHVSAPGAIAVGDSARDGVFAAGPGWDAYAELARTEAAGGSDHGLLPHAQDMLTLALPAVAAGAVVPAHAALPTYLRDEVAWSKP